MSSGPRPSGASRRCAADLADDLENLSVALSQCAADVRKSNTTHAFNINDRDRGRIVENARAVLRVAKRPQDEWTDWITVLSPLVCIRILLKWKVFENIPIDDTISYSDLAQKVNADVALLTRLAWNLVAAGILEQVGPDRVCHTARSQIYMTANPLSALACLAFDSILPSVAVMPKFFEEPKNFRKEPTDRLNSVVAYANGVADTAVWEIMMKNPDQLANFMLVMKDTTENWPFLGTYSLDWAVQQGNTDDDNKTRSIVVDIGGSNGHAIKAMLDATPGLEAHRCVLEDLPTVIEAVKITADPALSGVQLVYTNFHEGQPVKGALVYYIRRCLHDYGDDECVGILALIANAMAHDSRLLIVETIMQNPPSAFAAGTDLTMASLGGKERTLENFRQITSRAGLEILNVFPEDGADGAVIECGKKSA